MTHLTLGVLGSLHILLPDGSTAKLESDRARALLTYLAVEAQHPHRREALIGLIWPDFSEETARHSLRQALFNLRKAIRDSSAHPPYLLITREEIQFNAASDYRLDLAEFDAHLAACESHAHANLETCSVCAPQLQQAVDLYRGKFLQEFFLADSAEFEAWALTCREATHQRALDALTHLANYYEQQGDLAATRRCAARQLELDPWREPAHRQVMRVLSLDGQREAALAQYDTCRRVLADELGVEPMKETRELYEQIKTGNWKFDGGNRKPSAISNLQTPREASNLPTHLTPFIGRERELQDLGRLIGDPNCRWVTLVGPGGMGKTRLAVQVAANQRSRFAQGVVFVPLVAIESVDAIVPAIAEGLGFSFYGSTSPRVQLLNYLHDKQMLFVLDNVEKLLDAAELFIEILERTTEIKLLLTSHEPLNLQGEWVFQVEGLQMPADDGAQAIESSAAVALFVQRAQRTRVGFVLSGEDRPGVTRLCRLVDGMPLALELAATWVRTLSVAEIVREIERDLDFLRATVRDLPERHRSIRVVFNHSWELLAEEERRILLRLSVFRGGFSREAAERVAEASLSALSTLVAKSLVRRSGDNRYDLHELVRQFAAEHFAERPEEQSATQTRHGRYYLTYFSQADGRLRSSAQRETLAEVAAEMDNFRSAWDWAVIHGEFALIEQTLRMFFRFYDTRGWFQEGLDTLDRAVDALEMAHGHSPPDRTDQVALGHLLGTRAWFAYRLANYGQAQKMLERSQEILRPLNELHALVETNSYLGMLMEAIGNYARAFEQYSEGLETATAIGDRWFKVLCFTCLNGLIANTRVTVTVKPEDAHEGLRIAVAEWRRIGDPRLIGFGLRILSQSASVLGRYDEARSALEESAALNSSVGFGWGLGAAYRGLGVIAQAQDDHSQAVDMFRKSLDTFIELGGSGWEARVLAEMGWSILALGNEAEAGHVWRKSLRIATEIHGIPAALDALAGLASLYTKRGEIEPALELLLIVLNHPASTHGTKNRAEQFRTELEARLTPQQIESAQAQTKSFDQVVDQILRQLD